MAGVEIHKFGGAVLDDSTGFSATARLVAEAVERAPVVVVATAMAGVSDELDAVSQKAVEGDREGALGGLAEIVQGHRQVLEALGGDAQVSGQLERIARELSDLLAGVSLLGQLTARTRDRILAGAEKLSALLFSVALGKAGCTPTVCNPDEFLETDSEFGNATPQASVADRTISARLVPLVTAGKIPVVSGFCGRAPDGATTTLGRGGADLAATFIAAALGAERVTLWIEKDGVFNANPALVETARVVGQLNYREAGELSYYGAGMFHPRTMIPVAQAGIAVHIRNFQKPEFAGTVVDGRLTPGPHPVKAVSAIRDHCLLSVEGKGMAGVPGVAARVFSVLAGRGISVTMISQSSSEATICLAIPEPLAAGAEAVLKRELRPDLSRGDVEEVVVHPAVGLVSAVGLGMASTPGVAGRIFSALGREGVNVLAISQGSSELSISLAVEDGAVAAAVRAIHEEFLLGEEARRQGE